MPIFNPSGSVYVRIVTLTPAGTGAPPPVVNLIPGIPATDYLGTSTFQPIPPETGSFDPGDVIRVTGTGSYQNTLPPPPPSDINGIEFVLIFPSEVPSTTVGTITVEIPANTAGRFMLEFLFTIQKITGDPPIADYEANGMMWFDFENGGGTNIIAIPPFSGSVSNVAPNQ